MQSEQKYVLAIMGPTACGKTALAIKLAKYFGTEIISVDSRQVFKELNIGAARPTVEQLSEVPHHFINKLSVNQDYTAATFAKEAVEKTIELHQKNRIVVATGGSTLYFKAYLEGLDEVPKIAPEHRKTVELWLETEGIEKLQKFVAEKDPVYFSTADIANSRRLQRAAEVILSTGKPFSIFHSKKKSHDRLAL